MGSLSFMEADKPERTVNDGIAVGKCFTGVLFAHRLLRVALRLHVL